MKMFSFQPEKPNLTKEEQKITNEVIDILKKHELSYRDASRTLDKVEQVL